MHFKKRLMSLFLTLVLATCFSATARSAAPDGDIVRLFEHSHVAYGYIQAFTGASYYTLSGNPIHDNASFVQVLDANYAVVLYETSPYADRQIWLPYGSYALYEYNFNDIASQIRIVKKGDSQYSDLFDKVILFDDTNQNLGWTTHASDGVYKYGTGSYLVDSAFNDRCSGVYVPAGYKVTLYEHTNYSGKSITLECGYHNIHTLDGWNDVVSSLRVTATGALPGITAPPYYVSDIQNEMLRLVNEARARYGLQALTLRSDMNDYAAVRAKELAVSYEHTRPDGTSFSSGSALLQNCSVAGENIHHCNGSVAKVFEDFWNSEGHRNNMLNASYNSAGFGYYYDAATGENYWVQHFAKV